MGASYLWRVDVYVYNTVNVRRYDSKVFKSKLNAMDYANRMRNRGYYVDIVKWYGN